MADKTGRAIFLNGTSSSGKSTIAKELQKALPEPYMYLSIDAFLSQNPHAFYLANPDRYVHELPRLVNGFHSSCAAVARAGNNIIVDTVLQEPSWVAFCATVLEGLYAVFVAVRCPIEVVESREKSRGDRREGMARGQYDRVHSHGLYDVEVDTSSMSPDACVARIREYMESGEQPSAFAEIRRRGEDRGQASAAEAPPRTTERTVGGKKLLPCTDCSGGGAT